MDPEEFRREAHRLADWIADYLEHPDAIPFSPECSPGTFAPRCLIAAPERRRAVRRDLRGLRARLLPGHHALESSRLLRLLRDHRQRARHSRRVSVRRAERAGDAVADVAGGDRARGSDARLAAAAARTAGRLRRRHLRHRVDLDAARARGRARSGRAGRCARGPRGAVRCSRAARLLLRARALVDRQSRHPARSRPRLAAQDSQRRRIPHAARCARGAIADDRASGWHAARGRRDRRDDVDHERRSGRRDRGRLRARTIWLHVDAAYAGVAAMVPGYDWILRRRRRADSLVVNPHKWLFTPFDLSVLYCRRMDVVRAAFSLMPEYLKTGEGGGVRNLMDTGIQLGRRFRALKFWMVLRHFGAEGLRARLARAHAPGAAVRVVGRRERPTSNVSLRFRSASSVFGCATTRRMNGRAHPRSRERIGRDVPLTHKTRRSLRFSACDRQPAHDCTPHAPGLGTAESRRI